MSDPVARRQARSMVRTLVRLEMKLRFGDQREFVFKTLDLSVGGAFVAAKSPQPVGTLLRFELPLPPFKKPITGFGEVLWIRVRDDGRDKPAGMGIQFRYLDEPGEDLLREYVARLVAEAVAMGGSAPEAEAPEVAPSPAPLTLIQPKGPPTSTSARPAGNLEAKLWPPDLAASGVGEDGFSFTPPPEEPRPPSEALLAEPGEPRGFQADEIEDGPSPRFRRPLLALLAALLLLAAGVFAWGPLRGLLGGNESPSTTDAGPAAGSGDEEPPEVASAETPAVPAEPAAGGVSGLDPDLEPLIPAPSGPLTRLSSIRVGTAEGETIVVISGDGPITASEVKRQRLGGDRPRELLRIAGIRAPYDPAVTSVGTPELVRIRTGHHPEGSGGELYVVFDLPGPRWGINRVEHQAGALRVYLRAEGQ